MGCVNVPLEVLEVETNSVDFGVFPGEEIGEEMSANISEGS